MKKLKLVVSDFHLGRGRRLPNGALNLLEDFHFDHKFKELLEYYSTGPYEDAEVELVFNGDMLNLIQTDYHGHFTVIITEHVSITKLKTIIEGHPIFFKTLKEFLSHPKRVLTYIVGNHDQEMVWRSTRALFEEAVGKDVQWKSSYYQIDGMHIEHGHQHEAANRVDPTRVFLGENLPEPILNLPWGTLFTMQFLTKLKIQRPYFDKVKPFKMVLWWSLFNDTWFAISAISRLIVYFISTRFSKNRYRQSSLKTTLRLLSEASVFPDLTDAARRILRTPDIHTAIFGHTHVYKLVQIGDEKQYLNTGTWTDIVSLDLESFGRRSKLTYVRVDYENEKPLPLLRQWIGTIPTEDDAVGF
ncbi:MAG: metallophosphoesterase [Deltaproteobacteria bacterium]|nr:metallophosphoesterase [Deltaproteobacteria bacterium]